MARAQKSTASPSSPFRGGHMGHLTDDMTRLRGQITAFIKDLSINSKGLRPAVSKMRARFAAAHAEMARETKADRLAFVSKHAEMARETKADRLAFVSNLKRAVAGQLQEFRADIAGAHRAWFGKAT